MGFYNAMRNELLESDANVSITENGAVGYRSTGKSLLDINFAVASLRSATEQQIIQKFRQAFYEDKLLAMKWLFYARDVRGGLGERRLFRTAILWAANECPDIVKAVLPLIPEYGRYDDMWDLLCDDELRPLVIKSVKSQLDDDIKNYKDGKSISLLAKWLRPQTHPPNHQAVRRTIPVARQSERDTARC